MTALIDEHPHLGVEPVLRELHTPSSTYYRWRRAQKEPCERLRRDAELTGRIRQVHEDSGGTYGAPRVHAVLRREGVRTGRNRVERLMREAGLAGISPRRTGKGFTRRDPDDERLCLAPDGGWRPHRSSTGVESGSNRVHGRSMDEICDDSWPALWSPGL
ncbi:IS3 family transposase [Streptomyces sp. NPDC005970]|uniref:IS3 family transposase n=1 Tax=Streptomyces sp. NPDC005970 TaxID=3156723 RepID=UPI0033DC0700